MVNFLNQENENKKPITEDILKKYNITIENRIIALNFFYNFIMIHKINIKCYFSSIYMLDLFLINYSEDESNQENCQLFFKSKIANEISETRLILLLLCCFYIAAKFFNTKLITIDQLLQLENAKDEYTFDEMNDLINEIIIYTEANICDINIYFYIEFFLFDIRKRIKQISNDEAFIEEFEKSTIRFSIKIIQDISMQSISDRIKAIDIIIYSFELTKHSRKKNNAQLNDCFEEWKKNITKPLINYDRNGLLKVIEWLNFYMA
jgi:hypothetical protein